MELHRQCRLVLFAQEQKNLSLPTLTIVVPCFNEEEVLVTTNKMLVQILEQLIMGQQISAQSVISYVDDGSQDKTWSIIEQLARESDHVSGIKLSKNVGHQKALLCGLLSSSGEAVISVDADLQDDLDVIPQMIKHFNEGAHVVYGVRADRSADSWFKRFSAEGYYRLLSYMGVDVIFNHADYRLLSRRAIEALSEYREVNLFLRGLVRDLGFQSAIVQYERAERFAGESKYPLLKMLALAWQGVTSFSTAPLRLITIIGGAVSFLSLLMTFWGLFITLFTNQALPGWASTVVPIYFLGGVQLLCLGIIGEYVAKIYIETKARPRFHIDAQVGGHMEKPHA